MNNETNRSIRTKRLFSTSLANLLKVKSFEEIKVTDICDNAMLHRTTFYTHFEDKYELLDWTIREMEAQLEKDVNEHNFTDAHEYYMKIISTVVDHLDANRNFYLSFYMNNNNSIATEMIIDFTKRTIKEQIKNQNIDLLNVVPADIITDFYLGGVTVVLIDWLHLGMREDKEKIKHYIDILIPENMYK